MQQENWDERPRVVIHNAEFLRDVKYALRPYYGGALGQLQEAVACGLGHNSDAALRGALRRGQKLMIVDEPRFIDKLKTYNVVLSEGVFRQALIEAAANGNGSVYFGFEGEQVRVRRPIEVRLVRPPSEDEWSSFAGEGADWFAFYEAFSGQALPENPTIARAADLGDGQVDIAGWWFYVDKSVRWLEVVA